MMETSNKSTSTRWQFAIIAVALICSCPLIAEAQTMSTPRIRVGSMTDKIFLEAGSNYILDFSYRVPDLWVGNPDVASAAPIAPNQIMITGVAPGVCTMTISDPAKRLQAVTVHVRHNVRNLEAAIQQHFPNAFVQVHALNHGVVLKGEMATADEVSNLMEIADDYFPGRIINHMQVSGSQMIAINVRVYEVSRQKLRTLGIDWSILGDNYAAVQSIAGLIQSAGTAVAANGSQNLAFSVVQDDFRIDAFLKYLEQKNLAKLLDEPTLVAENGRAAEFLSGGEVPIQISTNFGATSLEYRAFGTKLDIVPLIHGRGEMTLEVRAEVSDVAGDLAGGTNSPGFRVRRVNTGVRMKAGATLALAGNYREETETTVRGIPGLMNLPGIGAIFRDTQETTNETELVFLITPKFIEPTQTGQPCGPGRISTSPSQKDFYHGGSVEVPGNEYSANPNFAYGGHYGQVDNYSTAPNYGVPQTYSQPTPYYQPAEVAAPAQPTPTPRYVPNSADSPVGENSPVYQETFGDSPPVDLSPRVPNTTQIYSPTQGNGTVPPSESKSPEKTLQMENPFENRATPAFNGPYGFSN